MRRFLLTLFFIFSTGVASANPPVLPNFPPLQFHPPKPERVVLPNGLVILLLEDRELPLIHVQLLAHTGSEYEPADKIGLGSVFAAAMEQGGSLTRKPEAIQRMLATTGANIDFSMSLEDYSGSMSCRTQDFDSIFDIFTDLLRHPAFDSKYMDLEKDKQMEALRRMNDEPEEVSRREFRQLVYGTDDPYARIPTPDTIKAIKHSDLEAFHKRYIQPNALWIAVSGDFDTVTMKAKIQKAFADWPKGNLSYPVIPAVSTTAIQGIYYVSQPSAPQSQIRIGHTGFARHNPDHFAWEVFNELWGGDSTSRLFRTVRTEMGLAYSVGSAYSEPADLGLIVTICQTRAPETTEAIRVIQSINQDMTQAPFSNIEIETAKQSIMNRYIQNFTSSSQIAGERMNLEYFGYPDDYLDTYPKKIEAITAEDLRRVAHRYLHPDQLIIFVMGDLSTFRKPLSTIGPIHEIKLRNPALEEAGRWQ